ncbi:DEAD/DEAH box helicase [Mammaliicoccus sciuri]|uniref:DEAD/DEAH box helicase n=1 Tax=Mammaliicoccus sciuri TaxID=1296 RepID=UPI002DBCFBD3|nr:DEAD/DEAH box helicase family protein [Mammaliicoccus sciuri]MEB8264660.1 DEAD/DEAH box helicase family protein [Mammaliicoccus sciuri]
MAYFEELYNSLNIFSNKAKLRNVQHGAIFAIASYYSIKDNSSLICMPTGTGKTAVIMLSPYILKSKKVLIITPSILVRSQITNDFKNLITLKNINIFSELTPLPKIFEMKTKYKTNYNNEITNSDVVVCTPSVALSLSQSKFNSIFDLVIVDEAHHEPAKTWRDSLIKFKKSKKILFTATPFRLDNNEIKADIIYNYPLSKAFEDKIFGKIEYINVEKTKEDNDINLAKHCEEIFCKDRKKGYSHLVMVRTNSKKNAEKLNEIYMEHTNLRLEVINSSKTRHHVINIIDKLEKQEIDGVICVDMMAEGFDFPNLKIAAIHKPHKSLASTLQFIGRFTRVNGEDLGSAKFLAINNEELSIENIKLFSEDAIWEELIINASETKIMKEIENKDFIDRFHKVKSTDEDLSLRSINMGLHAKLFRSFYFNVNQNLSIPGYQINNIYTNKNDNMKVFILRKMSRPKWISDNSKILDYKYNCIILYFHKESNLLFINSSIKNETLYKTIAEQFCGENKFTRLKLREVHKVLLDYNSYDFFNAGLTNNIGEGESYKISSRSNVSSTFDADTGQLYSSGHIFCKVSNPEEQSTIGYSSASKIWSSKYGNLLEIKNWCDINALKITSNRNVKTNTDYDFIPLPMKLDNYPEDIFTVKLNDQSYKSCHKLDGIELFDITDIDIKLYDVKGGRIKILVKIDNKEEIIYKDINKYYYQSKESIIKVIFKNEILSLSDYFNEFPLEFYTSNLYKIYDDQITVNNLEIVPFDNRLIKKINWLEYKTDITLEFRNKNNNNVSIHDTLEIYLKKLEVYDLIIYDHGTGEIADFICIKKYEDHILVDLIHVKAAFSKTSKNNNVGDIYEVIGQCIKSIIWIKNKEKLKYKILDRNKKGYSKFIVGNKNELKEYLNYNIPIKGNVIACQPSLSSETYLPSKTSELLSAVNSKFKNSGTHFSFKVWGS